MIEYKYRYPAHRNHTLVGASLVTGIYFGITEIFDLEINSEITVACFAVGGVLGFLEARRRARLNDREWQRVLAEQAAEEAHLTQPGASTDGDR